VTPAKAAKRAKPPAQPVDTSKTSATLIEPPLIKLRKSPSPKKQRKSILQEGLNAAAEIVPPQLDLKMLNVIDDVSVTFYTL